MSRINQVRICQTKPIGYGMSFRHNNIANVLMCDGYVKPGAFKQYEGDNGIGSVIAYTYIVPLF